MITQLLLFSGIQPERLSSVKCFAGSREVADIEDLIIDKRQVIVDESCDLWFILHDLGIGVDEERASKGIVAAFSCLRIGGDPVNRESIEGTLVLVEVSEAEVADCIGAAFDALDEHIIVFGELDIGSGEDGFFTSAFWLRRRPDP